MWFLFFWIWLLFFFFFYGGAGDGEGGLLQVGGERILYFSIVLCKEVELFHGASLSCVLLFLMNLLCFLMQYFEDFVAGHFLNHAHDILVACKAYIEGAQVGCLVKGGVQDVDEGDTSCSQHFRNSLAGFIKTVVEAFTQVGVKDCEKYLSLAQKTSQPLSAPPFYPDYGYPDYTYY